MNCINLVPLATLTGFFNLYRMKKITLLFLLGAFTWIMACEDKEVKKDSTTVNKEDESCVSPIKDPNDVKPMALMMRTMANYCDSMRLELNAGKTVDSVRYPLMPFWSAEPTDSSVLEELYFNNAKSFAASWRTLMRSTENQKENYTAVIGQCVNCHMSYCSGPLRRIKKLTLDYKE